MKRHRQCEVVVEDFYLDYVLHDAGWAQVTISTDHGTIVMPVSYLHDSLREITEAVIQLRSGAKDAKAGFFAEPGEHQLWFQRRDESTAHLEVRRYPDWASWGHCSADLFELLLTADISVDRLRNQVLTLLWKLLEEHGEKGYKEKSVRHDFPKDALARLQAP